MGAKARARPTVYTFYTFYPRSVTLAANLLADYADFSCSLWSHLSVA